MLSYYLYYLFHTMPGVYTFKLHARKSTYALSARTADDANEWLLALQDAIDSTLTVQTITERLVLEIIVSVNYKCQLETSSLIVLGS